MAVTCSCCEVEYDDNEDFVKTPNPHATGLICIDCHDDIIDDKPKSKKEVAKMLTKHLHGVDIKAQKGGVGVYDEQSGKIVLSVLPGVDGTWTVVCPLEKIGRFAKLTIRVRNSDIFSTEIEAYLKRQGYTK